MCMCVCVHVSARCEWIEHAMYTYYVVLEFTLNTETETIAKTKYNSTTMATTHFINFRGAKDEEEEETHRKLFAFGNIKANE